MQTSVKSAREILRDELLALAGGKATLTSHKERGWASITFAGTRHLIDLTFDGEGMDAGERFVAELPEALITVPGHLVADAYVTNVESQLSGDPQMLVTVEILTLEDK